MTDEDHREPSNDQSTADPGGPEDASPDAAAPRSCDELYELAVVGAGDSVWDWDLRSNELFLSSPLRELFDQSQDGVPFNFQTWTASLHPDDREVVLRRLQRHLEHDEPYCIEYRVRIGAGQYRWMFGRGACERDGYGNAIRIAGLLSDITERREREERFRSAQETYRKLFETARDGLFLLEPDGRFREANPALLRMLGYTLAGIRQERERKLTPPEWSHLDEQALRQCEARGHADQFEKQYQRRDGARITVEMRTWAVQAEEGRATLIGGAVRRVSDRRMAEHRVRKLAFFDVLTGLPNRQLFKSRLREAIDSARRHGLMVAVLFVDLDRFKQVNDTLGHSAGDKLLSAVALRFRNAIRQGDFVARSSRNDSECSISRFGGDEFTIAVTVQEPQNAAAVAERLQKKLRKPFRIENHEVFVGSSIGIALYPEDGEDVETLTRNADTAMYHAKERGRDMYFFYSDSMNASGLRKLEIEASLLRALETEAFDVHFQVLRNAMDARISGCEALVRWTRGELGPIPPDEFIPIAEETGMIVELGDWVLRQACQQVALWERAGFQAIPVSVNVSARQFQTDAFPARIDAILRETGVDASRLELEITESVFLVDEKEIAKAFSELKSLGVRISLDDFGTGYSALSYLRRFPIDRVKIDRSFVGELTSSSSDRALIQAIISMVHTLGMQVVAEGVELEEQAEILRSFGCDDLQGYLIGRPVPPAQFETFLRRAKTQGS